MTTPIDQAKELVAVGDKDAARRILEECLNGNTPEPGIRLRALFLLAQLSDTDHEAAVYLLFALSVDPSQQKIRARLLALCSNKELCLHVVEEAKTRIRAKDLAAASTLLASLHSLPDVDDDVRVACLFYLSQCLPTPNERIQRLKEALAIRPGHAAIANRLRDLESAGKPPGTAANSIQPEPPQETSSTDMSAQEDDEEGDSSQEAATTGEDESVVQRRPIRLSWALPFRFEQDVAKYFLRNIDDLLKRAETLPPTFRPLAQKCRDSRATFESWHARSSGVQGGAQSQKTTSFVESAVPGALKLAEAFLAEGRPEDSFWTANVFGEMSKIIATRFKDKSQDLFIRYLIIACKAAASVEVTPEKADAPQETTEIDRIIHRIETACLRKALSTYFQSASGEYRRAHIPDENLKRIIVNQVAALYFDRRLRELLVQAKPKVKDFIWANLPKVYTMDLPDEWGAKRQGWKKQLGDAGFQNEVDLMEQMGLLVNPNTVGELNEKELAEVKRAGLDNDYKRIASVLGRSASEVKQFLYRSAREKLATFREPPRPDLRPNHNKWFNAISFGSRSSDPAKLQNALDSATKLWQEDIDNLGIREWVAYLNARVNNPHAADEMFLEIRNKRRNNPKRNSAVTWNLAVLAFAHDENRRQVYEMLLPLMEQQVDDLDLVVSVLALSLMLEEKESFVKFFARAMNPRFCPLAFVVAYELGDKEKQQNYLAQIQRGQSTFEFPDPGSFISTRELERIVKAARVARQVDPLVAWLRAKIKKNSSFVPNYVQLAQVLEKEKEDYEGAFRAYSDRINVTKDSKWLEGAWHDLFDFCKRTKSNRDRNDLGIELGRKAYAAAEKRMKAEDNATRKEMLRQLLAGVSEFAPIGPIATSSTQIDSQPLKPAHPLEGGGRVSGGPQLPEEYSWVQAQLSGVRTVTQYLKEGKAVEEFVRILPQINPHESQVVVERVRQLSEVFEGFSRTESHDRDSRRLLYSRANALARELQALIASGAMSQQFANLVKPYANVIDLVVGDLSKQASILPTVQATIENPFVSLDTDSFLLVVRITNESDRPVTEVAANLILQTRLFSGAGVLERRIDRLAPHW